MYSYRVASLVFVQAHYEYYKKKHFLPFHFIMVAHTRYMNFFC
jgi:hypothetical protein